MPRKPIGPIEAQAKAAAHLAQAEQAVKLMKMVLNGEDCFSDWQRGEELTHGAKRLEAAGCYVRRAHADHLLIP